MNRRNFTIALGVAALQLPALAAAVPVKLYKNPYCGCCDLYAKHLEQNGFKVELINTTAMADIKQKYGIPERLEGCHTALIGDYVVEGLVPAKFVQQLLRERPAIKGIALPGMPVGAPGMDGAKSKPLDVYVLERGAAVAGASPKVYGTF